jgi:hypothetical protein
MHSGLCTALAALCFIWFCSAAYISLSAHMNLQRVFDFGTYYIAGQRLMRGDPVYEPITQEMNQVLGTPQFLSSDVKNHRLADSPAAVLLYAIFSLLPYRVAVLMFGVIISCSVVAMVIVTARALGFDRKASWILAMVGCATVPVTEMILYVHMEGLLLLFLVTGWLALRNGKSYLGGTLWGIAAALKLFPGLLLVGLIVQRRYRAAIAGASSCAFLLGAGLIVIGQSGFRTWVDFVLPQSRHWTGALGNFSLTSFAADLRFPAIMQGFLVSAVAIATIVVFWRNRRSIDLLYVFGSIAALLISPLSWSYYLVLCLSPLLVLAVRLRETTNNWQITVALLAVPMFFCPPLASPRIVSLLCTTIPTIAMVAALIVSAHAFAVNDAHGLSISKEFL